LWLSPRGGASRPVFLSVPHHIHSGARPGKEQVCALHTITPAKRAATRRYAFARATGRARVDTGAMNSTLTILGIAGSLRQGSYNRAALRAARQLAPDGAKIDIFEIDGIPGFNQDEDRNPPPKVVELKRRVREADAILFVTPEYNYSIPGVLKNAIDWASRPYGDNAWDGKPVAVMGASVGMLGSARAQYHLRQSFVFLNMYPVNSPEVMIPNAQDRFDAQGNLTDEHSKKLIRQLIESLVEWTVQLDRARQPVIRHA
jgi:chromate reductase